MGYNSFSPLAPAQVNVLCLPASRTPPDRFNQALRILQQAAYECVVDSETVGPQASEAQNEGADDLSPTPGRALSFKLSTSSSATSLKDSFYFEPNRDAQVILGIVNGTGITGDAIVEAKTSFESHVERAFPTRFCHSVVVIDSNSHVSTNDNLCLDFNDNGTAHLIVKSLSSIFYQSIDRLASRVLDTNVPMPQVSNAYDRLNGAEAHRGSTSDGSTDATRRPSEQTQQNGEHGIPSASDARRPVTRGLLNLQRGLLPKALDQFTEGAKLCRDLGDQAWHAKALEGILVTMILHLWFDIDFTMPQDCYPVVRGIGSAGSASPLADANRLSADMVSLNASPGGAKAKSLAPLFPGLISTIMDLYERSSNGPGERLPPLLVCEARVRLANVAIVLKQSRGALGKQSLGSLVIDQELSSVQDFMVNGGPGMILKSSTLATMLIDSAMEARARLSLQDSVTVFMAVCRGLSKLQLDRKQGFYLKDLLQKIAPLLVDARKLGAAEAGVHPSSTLSTTSAGFQQEASQAIRGLQGLLQLSLDVYGLPSPYRDHCNNEDPCSQASIEQRLSSWFSVFSSGDIATKLEMLRLCIRVTESLPDLEGSIHFMALLLRVCKQAITITPSGTPPIALITPEEQSRLLAGIRRALAVAEKSGSSAVPAQYWDDFLVRGIDVLQEPSAGKLMPHTPQDLSMTTASGTGRKDPFIYNPFSEGKTSRGAVTLVRGELATFEVILQNPLEIEIEINSISLITEGIVFEPSQQTLVLAPLSSHVFTLQGVPESEGTLKVTGCQATIRGCRSQNFHIYPDSWRPPHIIKKKSFKLSLSEQQIQAPTPTILECKIIPPLPKLQISDSTLSQQQSLMLLEGETRQLTFTLRNNSTSDSAPRSADLLLFTYTDTVTSYLQTALANAPKDIHPSELYELQYQLSISRPAIRRVDTNEAHIPAGESRAFTFEILGKLGLSQVEVCVDYACLGKDKNEVEGVFWTRQIRWAIDLTVIGSVEVSRCNVLPIARGTDLSSMSSRIATASILAGRDATTAAKDTILPRDADEEHCVLQLDLRNLYPSPLTATLSTKPPPKGSNDSKIFQPASTMTLQPGISTRALLLTPKRLIPDPHAPVPALDNKRQFVVSTSKLSLEAELTSREAFWYREKLLDVLKLEWVDESETKRRGEIDLRRSLRLTARMIDALRFEAVQITFDVKPCDEEGDAGAVEKVARTGEFKVKRNLFVRLVVSVKNLSQESLSLLLRLQPALRDQPHAVALDLGKKLAWSGALQRALHGGIRAGERREVELGLVPLIVGKYEVNATVEEMRAGNRREDILVVGKVGIGERRIWHAGRPCYIDAVE